MIRDTMCSFTDAGSAPYSNYASIVGPAGTYLAPNSVDHGPAGVTFSANSIADTIIVPGQPATTLIKRLWLFVQWAQAAAGGTSVSLQLITSAAPDLSSPTVLFDLGAQPTANLVQGFRQIIPLPDKIAARYLGVQAITTGAFTAGTYGAHLVLDTDSNIKGYAKGFEVK